MSPAWWDGQTAATNTLRYLTVSVIGFQQFFFFFFKLASIIVECCPFPSSAKNALVGDSHLSLSEETGG